MFTPLVVTFIIWSGIEVVFNLFLIRRGDWFKLLDYMDQQGDLLAFINQQIKDNSRSVPNKLQTPAQYLEHFFVFIMGFTFVVILSTLVLADNFTWAAWMGCLLCGALALSHIYTIRLCVKFYFWSTSRLLVIYTIIAFVAWSYFSYAFYTGWLN